MTMTDTGVKPLTAYVPPEDRKPRNAVDEKWMKLTRSARHYMERRPKARKETIDGSEARHLARMLQRPSDGPQAVPVLCTWRPRMGDGPATLHT